MKILTKATAFLFILFSTFVLAQQKTETAKVYGNCSMCKARIEKAANAEDGVKATWDAKSKTLSMTFDAAKTNKKEILKRVAEVGHDNETFTAPETVYAKLPGCCLYDRPKTKNKDK